MLTVYVFAAILLILLISHFVIEMYVYLLQRKGIYPRKGEESIEHVKRLVRMGKPRLAIRCYRAIHHTSLKEARQAVLNIN